MHGLGILLANAHKPCDLVPALLVFDAMIFGKFDQEGDGYKGRIFSRERCGRVITFGRMPVEQVIRTKQSETEAGDDEIKIGVAWKRANSKGNRYLLVKLDRPTLWNGAHCALIEQQDGSFGLVWKRTKLKAEEAAEAA